MLGGSEGIVTNQLSKMELEQKGLIKESHRPSFVTKITKQKIQDKIEDYQTKNVVLTIDDVSDLIENEEGRRPLTDSLRKYLKKEFNLKTIKLKGDEMGRVLVDEQRLINSYFALNAMIKTETGTILSSLTFNCDEVGIKNPSLNNSTRGLVPVSFSGNLTVGEQEQSKNTTILTCIAMDGSVLPPAIVVDKINYTEEVLKYFNKAKVYHNNSGFINSDIFKNWLTDIFIPEVIKRRKDMNLPSNTPALLILDNCPSHCQIFTNTICQQNNVRVHWLLAHTSHICQPLDVIGFGVFKQRYSKYLKELNTTLTNKELSMITKSRQIPTEPQVLELIETVEELNVMFGEFFDSKLSSILKLIKKSKSSFCDIKMLDKLESIINNIDLDDSDIKSKLNIMSSRYSLNGLQHQYFDKLISTFNSLTSRILSLINDERVRSANSLLEGSDEKKISNNNNIKCAYGHKIVVKLIQALQALYSSLDPYNIISSFRRVGIDSYNSNGIYMIKLDLSLNDILMDQFSPVVLTKEYSIIQNDNKDHVFNNKKHNAVVVKRQEESLFYKPIKCTIYNSNNKYVSQHVSPEVNTNFNRTEEQWNHMKENIIKNAIAYRELFHLDPIDYNDVKFPFENPDFQLKAMDLLHYHHSNALSPNNNNNDNNPIEVSEGDETITIEDNSTSMTEEEQSPFPRDYLTKRTDDSLVTDRERLLTPAENDLMELYNDPNFDQYPMEMFNHFNGVNGVQITTIQDEDSLERNSSTDNDQQPNEISKAPTTQQSNDESESNESLFNAQQSNSVTKETISTTISNNKFDNIDLPMRTADKRRMKKLNKAKNEQNKTHSSKAIRPIKNSDN